MEYFDLTPLLASGKITVKEAEDLEHSCDETLTAINGALRAMRDFTITINFDTRPICGVCQCRFTPGPEGIPVLTCEPAAIRVIACHACTVAMLAPND